MTDYNGWKNRDTWLANLWLSNDETAYNEARRIVREGLPVAVEHSALRDLAEAYVGDPFKAHLVDWFAVADAFKED